ncbi:MAG: hypothetical protein LBK65_02420, partial [Tannerellaceae bacterium]|nr:hypothetical protein [Tannerellaceae bacterium]
MIREFEDKDNADIQRLLGILTGCAMSESDLTDRLDFIIGQPHQNKIFKKLYLCRMKHSLSQYFESVPDPRVVGRCD